MSQQALQLIHILLLTVSAAVALYGVYFVVVALCGFRKMKRSPSAVPATRFALVVAARNEQAVIGQLVESLKQQNYPRGLYDIYVAPNNCTDHTRQVALAHGAKIFDPVGHISGKGEVLSQINGYLQRQNCYDAMCVFDADNLVHPDFLQNMNNACASGVQVAQGFRDSKNPTDTMISTCYSVIYWMVNRFYNAGRQVLGLSALVNGSGFMVSLSLLQKLGGWNTETMTEDYEFTAQCVLAGHKVHYVPGAIIYDEQPLSFGQSWSQRRRWSTGSLQGLQRYGAKLAGTALRRKSWVCLDLAITYATPINQVVSMLVGMATLAVTLKRLGGLAAVSLTEVGGIGAATVVGAMLACMVLASFVIWLNRGGIPRGSAKGILGFALFLLSWVPISLISIVRPKRTWDAIAHTRAVSLAEVGGKAGKAA